MTSTRYIISILVILFVLSGCHRKNSRIGKTISATYINVISGNEFDIKLEDGERVHAVLPVGTPPEAKEKVTKIMNKAVNPKVVFRSKVDKGWVVDIKFGLPECNGGSCLLHEESLVKWLKTNNLSWE